MHPLASIAPTYSGELGEEGVRRAATALCQRLDIPEDVLDKDVGESNTTHFDFFGLKKPDTKAPPSRKPSASRHPWSELPTGLSEEEERADPDLAEAIRRSLWAEQNGGVDVESMESCGSSSTMPASTNGGGGGEGTPPSGSGIEDMFGSPQGQTPILSLAHDETELSLDDIMSCVSADELRRIARARKVPPHMLASRESVMKALRNIARNQTTLSFTTVDRKGKGKATATSGRTLTPATSTSERLVLAQLMPCLGGQVIQIDTSLYTLVARVNLIFSRTPPTSAYTPALLLPPILVSSNRRQYPDYGTPTRSVIWKDRNELLDWEHAVHYDSLISEVLGDNWAEQRRGGGPVQSLWRGQPLSRSEGAKLVRRVWENVWPRWKVMVAGEGGKAVDAKLQQGGLAGDRFRTAHVLTRIVAKVGVTFLESQLTE